MRSSSQAYSYLTSHFNSPTLLVHKKCKPHAPAKKNTIMAVDISHLSANWKKLQEKIKTVESTKAKTPAEKGNKRKAGESTIEEKPAKKARKEDKGSPKKTKDREPPKKSKDTKKSPKKGEGSKSKDAEESKDSKPKATKDSKPSSKPSKGSPAKDTKMGNTLSSKIDPSPLTSTRTGTISPSLALWAAENDITPESLAEAYGLGLHNNSLLTSNPTTPNAGLTPNLEVGKYIALDCEMVGVGDGGHEDALARVSAVDFHGRQVYDSFVRPKQRVVDWRTAVSGVSPKHMATARSFGEVQSQIAALLKGRVLIGHDVKHDLRVLELSHPVKDIRDTAKYSGFRKYGHGPKPALKVLAKEVLGVEVQKGEHSSVEDARVAMLLFRKCKSGFDLEHAARFPEDSNRKDGEKKGGSGKGKGKKAKKR